MGQESTGKVESSIAMQFEVHATIMYVQKQYSALHALCPEVEKISCETE